MTQVETEHLLRHDRPVGLLGVENPSIAGQRRRQRIIIGHLGE